LHFAFLVGRKSFCQLEDKPKIVLENSRRSCKYYACITIKNQSGVLKMTIVRHFPNHAHPEQFIALSAQKMILHPRCFP
jgi:hypothetical protein